MYDKTEKTTEKNSFIKGSVPYADLGYLVCIKDKAIAEEKVHSIFVAWDRGEYGGVIVFGSGEEYDEKIELQKEQVGTLLKKENNHWDKINLKNFNENIWSVLWFQDVLYFATL